MRCTSVRRLNESEVQQRKMMIIFTLERINMKISYICFEVSSICNMDCKFCFANWREKRKQLPLEKVIFIIDKLKEYGVEAINLTGGDPLVRKDSVEVTRKENYYEKEAIYVNDNFMTREKIIQHIVKFTGEDPIISTTGIELLKNKEVLKYIDAINLPLDSFEQEIHNKMRPCSIKNHHRLILDLIEYIRKKLSKYKNKNKYNG